ncbi:MAG TPA: hypothetical protein VGQ61_02845, partial [Candidatus Angelobacter sp.]|nr:hypothetical protein [Candidatus Angelobacter sp.]
PSREHRAGLGTPASRRVASSQRSSNFVASLHTATERRFAIAIFAPKARRSARKPASHPIPRTSRGSGDPGLASYRFVSTIGEAAQHRA